MLHHYEGEAEGPTHPRPQFTRPWTDLSGSWDFAYDDGDEGRDARWWEQGPFDRQITVPYPPESPRSGIGDNGYHPVLWYSRTFPCRPADGQRILLNFGAVDYRASVWVNGHLVVEHEGGHTPFFADITAVLRPDGDQVVTVRAEDRPKDMEQPRGKQDWEPEPHAIWYYRTSGIWQPVWLEEVPETRIEGLHWTADVRGARLAVAARVRRVDDRPLRLRVRLSLRGEVLADDDYAVTGDEVRREVAWSNARMSLSRDRLLWSPEHPNLLDATVELRDGDQVIDSVRSYTAMRSCEAGDGRFQLNGQPYFLRLVLEQGFWPESHLAAPDDAALRDDAELIRSFGFNGVRLHQRVADPRFLSWCDRLGLLVWAEMPAAYEFSARSATRLTREWLEVLERDRSHPCVIAWVPFNESWGVPALPTSSAQQHLVRALYSLTKAVDSTRPVVGNDGYEQVVTDILTVHDYSSSGDTLRVRYGSAEAIDRTLRSVQPAYRSVLLAGAVREHQPIMVTEFGGMIMATGNEGKRWNWYGAVRDAESFVARYRSLVDALLDSPVVTGFCYTQFADTVQEQNGLVTELRVPKVEPERIRAINCRTSAAVPADSIGAFEFGDYPVPLDRRVTRQERPASELGSG